MTTTSIAGYRFVAIADPRAVADRVRGLAAGHALLGTVLVAGEGINLFLAGDDAALAAFTAALAEDARFAGIGFVASRNDAPPFARLRVRVKPEIIAFRRDDASPLDGRAPTVSPAVLARWLAAGHDDGGRRVVLVDTRNREEVGHGAFAGALTLPIDRFTQLPAALAPHRDALADATVVSYCTGGIRCEKAALWMHASGMRRVLQLEGGILGWFATVGDGGFDGRCFVFDARVAIDATAVRAVAPPFMAAPFDSPAVVPASVPVIDRLQAAA